MCCETALGVTLSSAAARTKLPSRALASKALSAFRGGSLRDMGVFRRRRFSFSTRRHRCLQYSPKNSVWVAQIRPMASDNGPSRARILAQYTGPLEAYPAQPNRLDFTSMESERP